MRARAVDVTVHAVLPGLDGPHPSQAVAALDPGVLDTLAVEGNADLMGRPATALFCSTRCPGGLILEAYDLANALRDAGITVVSGFHTPMEKECLAILLRGSQPIIICPARSLAGMRMPREWRDPLTEGRLLLLSACDDGERRATAATAARRNELVVAVAHSLVIIHAAPGSATLALCERAIGKGKGVFALDSGHNGPLREVGATMTTPNRAAEAVAAAGYRESARGSAADSG